MRINVRASIMSKASGCIGNRSSNAFYSVKAEVLANVFTVENKTNCQQMLLHQENVRVTKWIKGRENIRNAAVLIPMCIVKGQPSLLYTVRSRRIVTHRGEVSFPGGLCDPTDGHMAETALRETEEEIGLSSDEVDIWGHLTPVPGKEYQIAVTAVLAHCGDIDVNSLRLNKDEVDEVFYVPIAKLIDPRLHGYTSFKRGAYQTPVFIGGAHRIWGTTGILTDIALKLLINNKDLYNLELDSVKKIR